MGRFDDLITRLARAADSPHISPRAAQHRRISQKIEDAYASGSPHAEHWDARLDNWEERMNEALTDVDDNWAELSGGHVVDDAATGVTPTFAARYAEYIDNPHRWAAPKYFADNLRSVAEHGTGRYPTPLQPSDQDVFEFAKRAFEDREALKARYRASPKVMSAEDLIRRLR